MSVSHNAGRKRCKGCVHRLVLGATRAFRHDCNCDIGLEVQPSEPRQSLQTENMMGYLLHVVSLRRLRYRTRPCIHRKDLGTPLPSDYLEQGELAVPTRHFAVQSRPPAYSSGSRRFDSTDGEYHRLRSSQEGVRGSSRCGFLVDNVETRFGQSPEYEQMPR